MSTLVTHRQATNEESEWLTNKLRSAPTGFQRFKKGVENAIVLWAVTSLCFVVIWQAIAWVARKVADIQCGWSSPFGVWAVLLVVPMCGVYAVISSVSWVRAWKDYRPLLQADLDAGQVQEERHVFTAAKRFQEQDHGGLIYFMRTADDKVFTLFDAESQDLGVAEQDPLTSSFRPMSELVVVRAPSTGFVIGTTFSGVPLEPGDPIEIYADPEHWPDSESYCDIPWGELESRLGTRITSSPAGAAP